MPIIFYKPVYVLLTLAIILLGQASCSSTGEVSSSAIDPEDQAAIDKATCDELREEYPDFVAAEKELTDEIDQRGKIAVGTNLLGAATFATLGFGIFSWDTSADAKENLAELRKLRMALETAAHRKGCSLQNPPLTKGLTKGLEQDPRHFAAREAVGPHSGPYGSRAFCRVRCAAPS